MNKKATLFHWAIFGVLLGLGIFLYASNIGSVDVRAKGDWQTDFLMGNFLLAEKEILKTEILAKGVVKETTDDLALTGGFKQISPCGIFDTFNLLNKKQKYCFPDVEKNAIEIAEEKLDGFQLGFNKTVFFGKGKKKNISSTVGVYSYDHSFAVDMGYSFDEYPLLFSLAADLVVACRSETDLVTCLDSNKAEEWKYHSCTNERVPTGRMVPFCVSSTYLDDLKYYFALDFST